MGAGEEGPGPLLLWVCPAQVPAHPCGRHPFISALVGPSAGFGLDAFELPLRSSELRRERKPCELSGLVG